jgi:type IV pilus assembly protein PilO
MGKFNELPFVVRVAAIAIVGALVFAGAWYGPVPGLAAMRTANDAATTTLKQKQAENARLKPYEGQLKELELQIGSLQRQMDRQKQIVPDEKSSDDFIRAMQQNAMQAGIELRSFVAKPVAQKQYYAEAPFEIEIDGPYFAVLNFFEKVGTMDRIVNVEGMKMSGIHAKAASVVRHKYDYAPGETVQVSCIAKAFYSKSASQSDSSAPPAAVQPGAAKPQS